jgi:predicted transcriptional regulator
MTNLFLRISKDLFKLKLNPTEILILAQVIEFQNNTGDCFISDKALAEKFGVSESTIKREIKNLDDLGFITRFTRSVKGGKERHITANMNKIEEALSKLKLTLDDANKVQNDPCTKLNLTLVKEQNDTIKDNLKDNTLKDNLYECCDKSQPSIDAQEQEEIKVVGKIKKSELDSMGCIYEEIDNNLIKIIATNKFFEIEA